jgi:hypothetical protein
MMAFNQFPAAVSHWMKLGTPRSLEFRISTSAVLRGPRIA